MTFPRTLTIFCRVVDNFGDIGICWRLARQLQREHGIAVTLWVDDLASFRRICPEVHAAAARQVVQGITVLHWASMDGAFTPADVSDVVIEFFAVDLPPGYVQAMALCEPRPVWLNFEGLTAEEWVEGCHLLPSMHPRLKLTKHFFFPGFTEKTGGLLREADLLAQRDSFDGAAFLRSLGLGETELGMRKVSLFCYQHAPVAELLQAWQDGAAPLCCLVPEGVAAEAVRGFFARAGVAAAPQAGAVATLGALTLRVLPFLPQPDYERLLWACDFNFVRGEDSFVRAQWAGKPFVWHIYPQDENLHHKKLRAFLQRYAPELPALAAFSLVWNGAQAGQIGKLWPALQASAPAVTARARDWERRMLEIGDLASNMLAFIRATR